MWSSRIANRYVHEKSRLENYPRSHHVNEECNTCVTRTQLTQGLESSAY